MRVRRLEGVLVIVAAGLASAGSAGCAVSPVVRAAEQGHFEGLRERLAASVAQGTLKKGEATDFARAIAKGEIQRASGDAGYVRLSELRRCAREIDGLLGDRADKRDDFGAAAAMVQVEENGASTWRYGKWAHTPPGAPEGAWRALGARSLTSGGDGTLRRQLIADPYDDVRRNALHAAGEAADEDDTEALLEAARVDPYVAARKEAILAAGAVGGERVVNALKDLWPRAEPDVREAIVKGWAADRAMRTGGREQLGWVVGTQTGRPVLVAALLLVKAGGEGSGEAMGALERAVKNGPTADRVKAIEEAPATDALKDALEKAEADPDEAVAAAVMKRRLSTLKDPAARAALVAKLLPMASGSGAGAPTAREALALAGVREILGVLEKDGASPDPLTRVQAGSTLAMLGEFGRAAVVAADPEPHVRTSVACEILRVAGRGARGAAR
jgi:hypothetical protein